MANSQSSIGTKKGRAEGEECGGQHQVTNLLSTAMSPSEATRGLGDCAGRAPKVPRGCEPNEYLRSLKHGEADSLQSIPDKPAVKERVRFREDTDEAVDAANTDIGTSKELEAGRKRHCLKVPNAAKGMSAASQQQGHAPGATNSVRRNALPERRDTLPDDEQVHVPLSTAKSSGGVNNSTGQAPVQKGKDVSEEDWESICGKRGWAYIDQSHHMQQRERSHGINTAVDTCKTEHHKVPVTVPSSTARSLSVAIKDSPGIPRLKIMTAARLLEITSNGHIVNNLKTLAPLGAVTNGHGAPRFREKVDEVARSARGEQKVSKVQKDRCCSEGRLAVKDQSTAGKLQAHVPLSTTMAAQGAEDMTGDTWGVYNEEWEKWELECAKNRWAYIGPDRPEEAGPLYWRPDYVKVSSAAAQTAGNMNITRCSDGQLAAEGLSATGQQQDHKHGNSTSAALAPFFQAAEAATSGRVQQRQHKQAQSQRQWHLQTSGQEQPTTNASAAAAPKPIMTEDASAAGPREASGVKSRKEQKSLSLAQAVSIANACLQPGGLMMSYNAGESALGIHTVTGSNGLVNLQGVVVSATQLKMPVICADDAVSVTSSCLRWHTREMAAYTDGKTPTFWTRRIDCLGKAKQTLLQSGAEL